MKNYLTEAFKKLDVLDEDVFELDDDGIAQLKDFEIKSEEDDTVSIIDPEAEDEADLSDNYLGKVILDCCVCHSKIYKDADDVHLDEDGELANVDEECPFCYSTDGYKVIGQVTEFNPASEEEVEVKAEEDGDEEEVDVEVEDKEKVEEGLFDKKSSKPANMSQITQIFVNAQNDYRSDAFEGGQRAGIKSASEAIRQDGAVIKSVPYADSSAGKKAVKQIVKQLKAYGIDADIAKTQSGLVAWFNKKDAVKAGKLSESRCASCEESSTRDDIDAEADDKKERAKKAFARAKDDADSDRDYRLKKHITRKTESVRQSKLDEAPIYSLEPQFDSRKSFYSKAQVDTGDKGDKNKLYSYDTLVAEIKDGKPVVYGTYSQTTLRHIKDWLKQLGFRADSSKQIMADYGVKNESLDSISIDTGDQIIDVSAQDKEKPVEELSDEETIAPVSDEVKAEIEAGSEIPEGEDEVEVDEFSEEDFDGLGESYLKKAYNNVDSYKTTKASIDGNFLKLEGVIKFKSGNSKKTNFIFESKAIDKSGRCKFIGENAQICKGRKAFTVIGKIDSGKFLPESLNYNYKVKDSNTGVSKRVYGTVRTPKH